jgi:sterol desaturase/sphingolipid hydroxylase (fatty acid hydroxylase superfamily)
VFFYLFRDTFGSVEVLGINALGFAFNALGANLRHSHVYLSYGPGLERWLISPAQHHLHHARAARYHNKNFGSCLAIWDRLAGTLSLAEGREAHRQLRLGLAGKEANHGPRLLSALLAPVRGAVLPARSPGAEAAERARTSV